MDLLDQRLLDLLAADSRSSVTALARALGVSRVTVQQRMRRLEESGVIQAYTVRVDPDRGRARIAALVMISIDPKKAASLVRALEKNPAVRALHSVNGPYDLVAYVHASSTEALDQQLDTIGTFDGVVRTMSAIMLSTKFER
ncbi:MAG: Lrp/AsnC family transcriptional regulator [Myxococcales bacterium]|nr:Lrp/AsnC family transcriptional regulator [Myxococcales bacterium]MDH5305938.1 Lrp/AsnC family transcriptional regulator [Myxococcales bacterium]MDH5566394.1 Lrp/AsnC family transcriptional regulator [Myxococcales bacterium]